MASNSDAISPGTIAQGRKCLNRDLYVLFIDYEISGGPTHEGNFKSCVRFGLRWRVTGKGYTINRGVASKRSGYARPARVAHCLTPAQHIHIIIVRKQKANDPIEVMHKAWHDVSAVKVGHFE